MRAAVGLVVHADGRVLAVTNRRHKGWGLPGGKVETNETPKEALIREMQEEIGSVALPGDLALLFASAWGPDQRLVYLFHVAALDGEPRAIEADTECAWLIFGELLLNSPFRSFYTLALPDGLRHLQPTTFLTKTRGKHGYEEQPGHVRLLRSRGP